MLSVMEALLKQLESAVEEETIKKLSFLINFILEGKIVIPDTTDLQQLDAYIPTIMDKNKNAHLDLIDKWEYFIDETEPNNDTEETKYNFRIGIIKAACIINALYDIIPVKGACFDPWLNIIVCFEGFGRRFHYMTKLDGSDGLYFVRGTCYEDSTLINIPYDVKKVIYTKKRPYPEE
jgi:hypothetical protein